MSILDKFLKTDPVAPYWQKVKEINEKEADFALLSDSDLLQKSLDLKTKTRGNDLNKILPEAFALVREAAKRVLKQRHYDVQLIGGMVLHEGKITEMLTGEGKTLVA